MRQIKTNPRNYIDKQELHNAFVSWKIRIIESEEKGTPKPQIPYMIAKSIMDIAKNVARSASYRNYSWREDMEAKAMLNMVAKAEKYDPLRKNANAFAFLSFITVNTFKEYIPNEKKQYMIIKKYKLETQDIDTLTNGDISSSQQSNAISSVQNNALTLELYTKEISEVAMHDANEKAKKAKRKARLVELKEMREKLEGIKPSDLI